MIIASGVQVADKSSKYPDNTGFQFDLAPANRVSQDRGEQGGDRREGFYGAEYIELNNDAGYQPWTNWIEKFQPDVRFAAVSDETAWTHAFPEVDSPWKFTDYTFKGVSEGTKTVEPPLFDPVTLTQTNAVRGGRLDGRYLELDEDLYLYQNDETGNIFEQETLEENGWQDPTASDDFKRCFTRLESYDKRLKFIYPTRDKGVRLYHTYVEVESTKMGEHANIPPHTIGMMAPNDYFEPDGLFSSTVVPKVTATAGSAIVAANDGIVDYSTGTSWSGMGRKVLIDPVDESSYVSAAASGTRFEEWSFSGLGAPIEQPSPAMSKDNVLEMKFIGTGYSEGDFVHKGCAFWEGNVSGTLKCTLAAQLSEGDSPNVPDPSKCPLYPTDQSDAKEYYRNSGGLCPHFQHQGPQDVALYEATARTASQWAKMYAGIDNYDEAGGSNNLVNGGAMFDATASPMGGGALMYGGFALGAAAAFNNPTSTPRQMGEMDVRYNIEYEYKKIPAAGRESVGKNDYIEFVRGTGRFAFDKKGNNTKGVDTPFFGDRNLMSAWRFNHSAMPCYDSAKCNIAYGHQMMQGWQKDTYAGVDGEDHCRYYNQGCPHLTVPRRAYEYDRNYVNAMENILDPFRTLGVAGMDLSEYMIDGGSIVPVPSGVQEGVFLAIGSTASTTHYSFDVTPSPSGHVYFYYNKSSYSPDHLNARVFAHIEQFNHENSEILIAPSGAPSSFPTHLPWLVELHDDYRSPSQFTFFVDNERRFFGGRHPEYKDLSKVNRSEVMVVQGEGGGVAETTGGGRGGDPEHTVHDKGYYRGYWIDIDGEYIVDSREIGNIAPSGYEIRSEFIDPENTPNPPLTGYTHEIVDISTRVEKHPGITNGATPIAGVTANTVMSPQRTVKARVTQVYVFSSDTREVKDCYAMTHIQDPTVGSDKILGVAGVKAGHLPTERSFFRCPQCSYDYLGGNMVGENANPTIEKPPISPSGYPSINKIFTDFEAEAHGDTCPVCGTTLVDEGQWGHFPDVYAGGAVTVYGLPGSTVREDGYYWRHPTVVSRGLVSQILTKIGPMNEGGYGYTLEAANSANAATEAELEKYIRPSGSLFVPGPASLGKLQYSHDPSGVANGMPDFSDERLDGNTYADNLISPYDNQTPGLDLVSISHMKKLRNMVQPMYGYQIGKRNHKDFRPKKQPNGRKRYSESVERDWYMKPGYLEPEILAATTSGQDNRDQYWDGQFPGTILYEYFPSGPTWWRINDAVGAISRDGGINYEHLDADGEWTGYARGYTGDKLVSKAFHFLHGYVPLDKEVVKAYAILEPIGEPEKAPIGIVWSGGNRFQHYHAFRTKHEHWGSGPHFSVESSGDDEVLSQINPASAPSSSTDEYVSYMWNRPPIVADFMANISSYYDDEYGTTSYTNDWADTLTWAGLGEPLVQNGTEESLWKTKTYDEFRSEVKQDMMRCRLIAGEESEGCSYDFYMFSRRMLDKTLNNEVQAIPGYFNLSGMNDRLMYPKAGPVFEPKNENTDWATGGQVLVQAALENMGGTGGEWNDGGFGNANAGFVPRVLDITNVVKKRYNARVARSYKVSAGLPYTGLESYNNSLRNNPGYSDGYEDPDPNVNYRYSISGWGTWLNDPWHYPKLVNDEFPVIINGEEIEVDPSGRLTTVSSWYKAPGVSAETDEGYYDYHPVNLIKADTGESAVNGVPAPSGYWYNISASNTEQSFEIDLRPFPVSKTKRPYRYQSGKWDVSNAICPNANCAIGGQGFTVAEFMQWSQSRGRATVIPSLSSPNCAMCGTSLVTEPATGAQYVDGDGIETTFYLEKPSPNVFVSAVKASPVGNFSELSTLKHDFFIDVKADGATRWRNIVAAEWDADNDEWIWKEFNENGNLVYVRGENLPDAFEGVWADAEDITTASSADYIGKNFIIPRIRHIRYRAVPKKQTIYHPTANGDTRQVSPSGHAVPMPSGVELIDSRWEGGRLQIAPSGDFSNSINSYEIISNGTEQVFLAADASGLLIPPSGGAWRLKNDQYISVCGQIEVYGNEYQESVLTITDDSETFASPFSVGSNTITLNDFPTKIISVEAGTSQTSDITMTEVENGSDVNFVWKTQERTDIDTGVTYQKVVSGTYYFTPSTQTITVPTTWKNETTGQSGNIWTLNTEYQPDQIGRQTIPQFVQVRYFIGIGVPITVPATATGGGPSYQVEKECINAIAGYEPDDESTPAGIETTTGSLPDMGKTVKLGNTFDDKKQLRWQVYNHKPMYGQFSMGYMIGNELPAGGWEEGEIAKMFGGTTQEDTSYPSKINGTVSGEVTLYGAPNSIISGDIYVYAPALTIRKYRTGNENVVTYERTGGLKYTGFSVGVEIAPVVDNRQGVTFNRPTVLVYLKERALTDIPEMT